MKIIHHFMLYSDSLYTAIRAMQQAKGDKKDNGSASMIECFCGISGSRWGLESSARVQEKEHKKTARGRGDAHHLISTTVMHHTAAPAERTKRSSSTVARRAARRTASMPRISTAAPRLECHAGRPPPLTGASAVVNMPDQAYSIRMNTILLKYSFVFT